ncbi:MAG: alpha/beta hydrolase [Calothrix sp. SM1_7_51]|nr:alpha/beta hydrolase [Calothrix sp. SM1_7_51]
MTNYLLLIATTLYQVIASLVEDKKYPPGKLVDVGGYNLHLCVTGCVTGEVRPKLPTVVLEHSLGGVEGYLLAPEIAKENIKIARVCIYDRAGYGWSQHSPKARTSKEIIKELDILLTKAEIEPPYILVGDSFGSYNVRLYAQNFPEKVVGMVLTDGLHEIGMLNMTISLKLLKLFFTSGFFMSVLGSSFGFIRLFNILRIFEFIKPELRKFSSPEINYTKRSFCRPKHWVTMAREIINLDASSRQVANANNFGDLPIVSIKASSFFRPSIFANFLPMRAANKLRDKMHVELLKLSNDCTQMQANKSSHFVWVDEPEIIVAAIKIILDKINPL